VKHRVILWRAPPLWVEFVARNSERQSGEYNYISVHFNKMIYPPTSPTQRRPNETRPKGQVILMSAPKRDCEKLCRTRHFVIKSQWVLLHRRKPGNNLREVFNSLYWPWLVGGLLPLLQAFMGVGKICFGGGSIVDFSRSWPKGFFLGEEATVVKFHFPNSKLKGKHFHTKNLKGKYQILKSRGAFVPPFRGPCKRHSKASITVAVRNASLANSDPLSVSHQPVLGTGLAKDFTAHPVQRNKWNVESQNSAPTSGFLWL